MKLPNWIKITWWIGLTGGLTAILYLRSNAILAGRSTAFDLIAFVIWIALLLLPLFAEIELWGLKLKAHIDEVKSEINGQLAAIRSDIRNEVRTTISPTFYPSPPADAQLPKIREMVSEAIREALQQSGTPAETATVERIENSIDKNTELLFATRYRIERELRRIATNHGLDKEIHRRPLSVMLQFLVKYQLLDESLAAAVREVYSVCSPAIHGEKVSEAQIGFVRDVAPKLLSALVAIG